MLAHVDLIKGIYFLLDGQPHEVLESSHMFKGRGSSVMQTRIKNMRTGNVMNRTFHAGEQYEEAEVEKVQIQFIYERKGKYVFSMVHDPSKRFELSKEQIGPQIQFLLSDTMLEGLRFKDEMLTIRLPIKMNIKVQDSPPGVKGNRAQAGTKTATLKTGAIIQVPLFVETGDVVEINTEKGEYVRRIQD